MKKTWSQRLLDRCVSLLLRLAVSVAAPSEKQRTGQWALSMAIFGLSLMFASLMMYLHSRGR